MRLLPRVLHSIQRAKVSHTQLPDMPLRRDTQALRFIARIPLIQRRKKYPSREGKSAFAQWSSSVYARRFKDQVRQSKYPRMQILGPRTKPKLICHSSATFIPARSNNLIQVTSQSYIAFFAIQYSSTDVTIYLYMGALRNGLLHVDFRREVLRPILVSGRTYIGSWYVPILLTMPTYIALPADQYRLLFPLSLRVLLLVERALQLTYK